MMFHSSADWLWIGAGIFLAGLVRAYFLLKNRIRELLESNERLELALHGSRDGLWDWKIEASEVYYSPRWKEILGYEDHELANSTEMWLSVVHPDDLDNIRKKIWSYLNRESPSFSVEHRLLCKSGVYIWVQLRGVAHWNAMGKAYRIAGTISDITKRKETEAEVLKAQEMAMSGARAKEEFLVKMSHEIRTPINSIIGMNSLLLDTSLSAEQQEYTRVIDQAADGLLTIINDILDFSKIEAERFELEIIEFDLVSLLNDISRAMSYPAAQKGLQLNLEILGGLRSSYKGDPSRLRQILMNLIGNAIKFTNEGYVNLSISTYGESDGSATSFRFEVEDTGIGIPPHSLDRIFQAFRQADNSTSRRFGGTGLGLAISRQLAQLMGGSLQVESLPDQGTRFWLNLDLQHGETDTFIRRPKPVTTFPQSQVQGRILLAEDNIINQKILVKIISKFGFRVIAVANGTEVLDTLRSIPVDLILMDCQMPEMDGYEATRIIRESKTLNCGDIPIIAMTAHALSGARERCLAAGMNDYLTKPVTVDLLFSTIEKWLKMAPRRVEASGLTSLLSFDASGNLVIEMATLYRQNLPIHIQAMQLALSTGDLNDFHKQAHDLKSASRFLGFDKVADICSQIESLELTDSIEDHVGLFQQLGLELGPTNAALDLILAKKVG